MADEMSKYLQRAPGEAKDSFDEFGNLFPTSILVSKHNHLLLSLIVFLFMGVFWNIFKPFQSTFKELFKNFYTRWAKTKNLLAYIFSFREY